jgi:phosphopentomutase
LPIARVVIIVMDSVGVGALPDAAQYGDEGSNTLGHISEATSLELPRLVSLGLGSIVSLRGVEPSPSPKGAFGKMAERSVGKDTITGHWEIGGVIVEQPFPTYPEGFPPEVIAAFRQATGRGALGNKVASGTEIIAELGEEHLRTGWPIVYTSADSVFQIAAHQDVLPEDELYHVCRLARDILQPPHGVARVIARPFTGRPGAFSRTPNRRDFSLPPPHPTILDALCLAGHDVWAVGKISDIFAGHGISRSQHSHNNMETIDILLAYMDEMHSRGMIFANCVDFDMLWGHRNDVEGYARGLEEFDARLPEILGKVEDHDLLMILADHGCDPTMPGTDHTREYVPLLVYGPACQPGADLGVRSTFADVAATVAEAFGLPNPGPGTSFLSECLVSGREGLSAWR